MDWKKTWKPLVRHVSLLAVVMFLLVEGAMMGLRFYTGHNESFPLPDYTGSLISGAVPSVVRDNLRWQIIDSVYTAGSAPGTIIQQNPLPGSQVKKNRTVFFTINAKLPEMVPMPDLRGKTLRLATAQLASFGLKVGQLEYDYDMAAGSVLRQKYRGREIAPDTGIPRGAVVDLVVGEELAPESVLWQDSLSMDGMIPDTAWISL